MTSIMEPASLPVTPRRPWWRRWYALAAAGAVLAAGLAVALLLTVFASSPTTAKGILAADGYANAATMTHQQFMTMNSSSSDAQMYGGLIGNDIAFGTKGKTLEIAVQLSASGKGLITALLPAMQTPGVTTRMDGDYLVMSGPASSFNGLGGNSSPAPATTAPASSPPASSAPTAGPVGTTFTVSTRDISGNVTSTYKIQLVHVADPAAPDSDMKSYDPSMYPAGTHLVGLQFQVDGVADTADNSPGMELSATDSTGQVYSYSPAELAASMPDFSGANIGPGEHDSGWVAFQVPDGTHLASVKYSPMSGTAVTWNLGG